MPELTPEDVAAGLAESRPNRPEADAVDPDFKRAMEKPLRYEGGQPILDDVDAIKRYAKLIWETPSMNINGAKSQADVLVALLHGLEAGLSPTMCIKNVLIVNGRPSIWGDCLLGLVLASGELADFNEAYDAETETATCRVVRFIRLWDGTGREIETVRTFSREDANTAGLTGRGVHRSYPVRMLQQRARGFALRDAFADRLAGLGVSEDQHAVPFDPSHMKHKGSASKLLEAAGAVDTDQV